MSTYLMNLLIQGQLQFCTQFHSSLVLNVSLGLKIYHLSLLYIHNCELMLICKGLSSDELPGV